MSKIQLRGNCPICGSEQAIVKGKMSKHGYTVENGWFSGVCSGRLHAPLQVSRVATDAVIEEVESHCIVLAAELAEFESGKKVPQFAASAAYYKAPMVPFAEAPEYFQKSAVYNAISQVKYRIRSGQAFVKYMSELADKVHGQPVLEVVVSAEVKHVIQIGEKRVSEKGYVLTCVRIEGARVYWKTEKCYTSWTGSTSWRKLEQV